MEQPRISSFLVKVASRCNLNCDYCYVYHHADQTWRTMPNLMSHEVRANFAARLAEYTKEIGLTRCAVIFHGGEPLLAGAKALAEFANDLRAATLTTIDVSIQTNGLLLDDEALDIFEAADIGVSLSLDGPRFANDKHRLTRKGSSSFDKTQAALIRLQHRPKIFSGVIAVIDATTSADDLFKYFSQFSIPQLDFLLPDAHHLRPPPMRDENPDIYKKWMINAFDLWLDEYPHIRVRTFEALLDVVTGLPSGTDAFGFGDVSLISIETDGSYHDLDVLKVTKDGATQLFGTVKDTGISDVIKSTVIQEHREYLKKSGLCDQCQACPIVEICGGGSLPHRYGENEFNNPTVYCGEMLALVNHVATRLNGFLTVADEKVIVSKCHYNIDYQSFELAENAESLIDLLCNDAEETAYRSFISIIDLLNDIEYESLKIKLKNLSYEEIKSIAIHPGVISWCEAYNAKTQGKVIYSVDGQILNPNFEYLHDLLDNFVIDYSGFRLGEEDLWLQGPFGDAILFESKKTIIKADATLRDAFTIIEEWRPKLAEEMRKACRAIQFIRDPLADPQKIVSFSDNSVPGALYVSIVQGDAFIDPYDLADSLIHEHRHQKLYLLERQSPMVEATSALVPSPWREELRPPTGLLHAVFVFVELRRFWLYVKDSGPERTRNRAINQIEDTNKHLKEALITLKNCPLTEAGQELVKALRAAAESA